MGLEMGISARSYLLGGAFFLSFSHAGTAAEMDKVIFAEPARYDPAEIERYDNPSNGVSGFVEGSFAYGTGKTGGFSADGTQWALRGSVNAQLDEKWNIQLDGLYNRTSTNVLGVTVDVNSLVGAAHAYYRVPETYAVGAFVQGSRFNSGLLVLAGITNYATDVVAGGEAAVFTDYATFHAQLGFGRAFYSGLHADQILGKAGVRVYATDNIRFDADGIWNRLSGFGGNADLYSIAATGNYRFSQMPATVFAGYQYDYGKISAGGVSLGDASAHSFRAGLRFHWGSGSLKDEERKGAVWSPSGLNL